MDDDYFSIEAILGENQKVGCVFKEELSDIGHLIGHTEHDIKPNTKVAIPLWLAYTIIYSDWADFHIPQAFGPRVRGAVKAEARSVRLQNQVGAGGYWYGFGKSIMDMLGDEQANDMSEMLTKTFQRRLIEIIDQAQHFAALGPSAGGGSSASGDPAQAFREGLDSTEREMFTLAQNNTKSTKLWYEASDKSRR